MNNQAVASPAFFEGQAVRVSNSEPEPPKHHTRKHGDWSCRNYDGTVYSVESDSIGVRPLGISGLVYSIMLGGRTTIAPRKEKFAVSDEQGKYVFYSDDRTEAQRVRSEIDSSLADEGKDGCAALMRLDDSTDEYELFTG